MARCVSSALIRAILVTLLLAGGHGLARGVPLHGDAIATAHADAPAAPSCCLVVTGKPCPVGCVPVKAEAPPGDPIDGTGGVALCEPTRRLEGRRPAPEPMPPEAARA